MDPLTSDYYAKNARLLSFDYSRADPAHFNRLDRVFADAQTILDIGCGTGRDCLYLLSQGKDAYGVDASSAMLAEAAENFKQADYSYHGRLLQGSLPKLDSFGDGSCDGILCSGVLMHLPEEAIFDAVYAFKRVLRSGGILMLSIPSARPGIDPITRRDAGGRLFTDLPFTKLQLLFERVGFRLEASETTPDSLGRPDYKWRSLVFRRLDEGRDRPLHLVEGILNRDQKVATYKLALIRALAEIAQTKPHMACYIGDDKVCVPNALIAEKWMFYYWPIFAADTMIRQGTSTTGADVAIRPALEPLIDHYKVAGGLSAFYVAWKSGRLDATSRHLTRHALSTLKRTIWNMPVRHAGGREFDVLQYDKAKKTVVMDATLWRELCLTGNWIHDATILRWAELTEQFNNGAVKASRMIDCLLTVPDGKRNVADAKRFFVSLEQLDCVWTGRRLPSEFEIDHAIPFSLWRNNDLWNLFPSSKDANSSKRDKLPSYELLQGQRDLIVHYWRGLDDALGERFQREAQTLLGSEPLVSSNWEARLFSRFVEAFETTAAQRCVDRWEPAGLRTRPQPIRAVVVPHVQAIPKLTLLPFHEVGKGAFHTHLPLVASLAAGQPFHGFEINDLSHLEEVDWVSVPSALAKPRRFVVRVVGESMEPTLCVGDLVIFEYHRSPRKSGEIVIANLPELGEANDGIEAIKRFREDVDDWLFESDNPNFSPFRVGKCETSYPILGTMVEILR